MKKMKTTLGVMVSAAVCVLALAGCSRESMEKETGEVKFGFTSVAATTRTEFENHAGSPEGVTPSGTTKEQVNWVVGDVVTICSDRAVKLDGTTHVSEYEVSSLEGRASNPDGVLASVDNHGTGGGLRWADETNVHKFFAVYGTPASISMDGGVTGATIPANQTLTWNDDNTVGKTPMTYAYMVGLLKTKYETQVVLPMRQMYTAFQFTVSSGDNAEVGLSTFTLSSTSTALAGGFTVAYPGGENPSIDNLAIVPTATAPTTSTPSTITVNFPTGFKVLNGKPVTFTVLALGQELTDLSITFAGETLGTRTLALNKNSGKPIVFSPSTKNLINGLSFPNLQEATGEDIIWEQTAVGEDISWQGDPYVLVAHDPSILSYLGGTSTDGSVESYKLEADGQTKTPVTWQVVGYYPTEQDAVNGTNAYVNGSGNPDVTQSNWATSFTKATTPETGGIYPVTIVYNPARYSVEQTNETRNQVNAEIASSNFGSGSGINNYLNLANPGNMASDVIVESANSYIVNGPGYYRIPLVMGNGIKDNKINEEPKVYMGNTSGSAKLFKDYKDQNVTSPLLQMSNSSTVDANKPGTPTSAFVVWQDAPLIAVADEQFTVKAYEGGKSLITTTQLPTGETVYWLNFHVSVGTQGNALLAVTDGDGTVMWSYHIWVTNYVSYKKGGSSDVTVDLKKNRASENKIANYSYTLMTVNLGWVYGKDLRTQYEADYMYVKVLQDGPSGKTDILKVLRDPVSILEFCDGTSPTYQWGRHVPMRIGESVYAYPESYPSEVTITGKYPDFLVERYYNSGVADSYRERTLGATLQHPEVFYGLMDAYGNGNWCRILPMANLWSVDATISSSSYGSTNADKVAYRNHEVHKTIYDPCPAGYSVPCYGASAFRPDDGISNYTSTYNPGTNKWSNLSLSDLQKNMNVAGGIDHTQMRGFFFYSVENDEATASGTNTSTKLYYPAQNYRSYTVGQFSPNGDGVGRGLYWTALNQGTYQSCGFDFYHTWSGNSHTFTTRNYNHFPTADGCFIRPMQNAN